MSEKNSGKLPKFSEKNAGLLYKKSEKRKVVQACFSIQLGGVKGTCMVAFSLLIVLLRPVAQKAPEVKLSNI